MKQRITFTATIDVDTEGLDWGHATGIAQLQMSQTEEAFLKKVIRIEIVEDEG